MEIRKKECPNDSSWVFNCFLDEQTIGKRRYYDIRIDPESLKRFCENCDISNTKKVDYRYNCIPGIHTKEEVKNCYLVHFAGSNKTGVFTKLPKDMQKKFYEKK
mgnify:CR=1 FL=1